MPAVKIRVGAAIDADLTRVFDPLVESAQRARKQIDAALGGAGTSVRKGKGNPYREAADEAEKAETAITASKRKGTSEREAIDRASVRRILAGQASAQREFDAAQRKTTTHASNIMGNGISTFGRVAGGMAGAGVGILKDMVHGAGINFDVAGGVKKRMDLQATATEISNSGYMEKNAGTADPSGTRQDPRALMAEAQSVGAKNAIDPSQALEGVGKFTGITGDLATARSLMGDMAKLSKATGSNMGDVVATAGEISKAMGPAATSQKEAETRAKAVYEVMKGVAGQGKLGSVEMKDNARYFARMAAAAGEFGGDKAQNILKMGALSQEARGGGGAWSASTAAGAVTGFVNTLKTDERSKHSAFAKYGVKLRGDDGNFRDSEDLIVGGLRATKGEGKGMGEMFKNVMGARAIGNYTKIFRDASGGKDDKESLDKGEAAVRAEMKSMLKDSMMSQKEVDDSAAASMQTVASQAQLFQQKLDQVVGDLADQVLPKVLEMAPKLDQAMGFITQAISMAMANPGTAIGVALGASIAKAGVEEAVGEGMKTLMAKAVGAFGGAGLAGLAVAAMYVTASLVNLETKMKTGADDALGKQAEIRSAAVAAVSKASMPDATDADRAAAQDAVERLGKLSAAENAAKGEGFGAGGASFAGKVVPDFVKGMAGMGDPDAVKNDAAKEALALGADSTAKLQAELSAKLDALNTKLGGTLNVRVQGGMGGIGGPPNAVNTPGSTTSVGH